MLILILNEHESATSYLLHVGYIWCSPVVSLEGGDVLQGFCREAIANITGSEHELIPAIRGEIHIYVHGSS